MPNRRAPFGGINNSTPGGGSGGTQIPIVATWAILSTTAGTNGQTAFVLSTRSYAIADTSSTRAADGITVVNNPAGGRWLRTTYSDPAWRSGFAHIYIDPANSTGIASDENRGWFAAAQVGNARLPVLSWQEIFRRIGNNPIRTSDTVGLVFTIHVLSSSPVAGGIAAADPADFNFVVEQDTFPQIQGEANTVLLAGNLDAVGGFTAQNPTVPAPGGAACQIKVGAQAWGAFLKKRIRFTATGAVAYILKDLGGGSARISQPQLTNMASFAASPTNVNPANGTAFVVEDLANMHMGDNWNISFQGSSIGVQGQMMLGDINVLNIAADPPWTPAVQGAGFIIIYQCTSDRPLNQAGTLSGNGSAIRDAFFNNQSGGGNGSWFGGAIMPTGGASGPAPVVWIEGSGDIASTFGCIDFSTYIQAGAIVCGLHSTVGDVSVWDTAVDTHYSPSGHAIRVGGGSPTHYVRGLGSLSIRGQIFGTGAAGVGMQIASLSRADYQILPNITGVLGDFKLADSATGFWWDATATVYKPAAGAGVACTWANLAAVKGAAGFGGSAHELDKDAHIVLTSTA